MHPVSRRLPLVISSLALIVALSGVGPADAARAVKRALFANNAGKVNGIGAARKPRPNKLVPLGGNAKFPKSVIPSSLTRGPRGPQGPPGPAAASGGPVNPYVFRAHKIAAQDSLAATGVKVVIGGEDFDPHGDYDPAASRYTAPLKGYYQFSSSVSMCCPGGRLFSYLRTNRPNMETRGSDVVAPAGTINRSVATGLMHLQAGDTVELFAYTENVGSLAVEEGQTFFSGYLAASG
jgi:hypothetical protein